MSEDWIRADWPAPANVRAGATTRNGGVSEGRYASLNLGEHVGDDPASVAENRRRFVTISGLPTEPRWLGQVHGVAVSEPGDPDTAGFDAAIGRSAGAVCAVMTADCLPMLLCASDGTEIAAIHAGWRGLAAGIVAATLSKMQRRPADLIAWLGPAIAQPAFEVGDDVRVAFLALDAGSGGCFEANARGRWQADLYGLARRQLDAAGVAGVYGGGMCTVAEPERFFSYRRDGQCGRMATFVCRLE